MPGRVSCRLYLLLDASENFDISLHLRSREISNSLTHLEVNTTDRKHTLSYYSICIEYYGVAFRPIRLQTRNHIIFRIHVGSVSFIRTS